MSLPDNSVNLVLQPKGGVGKSFVAAILAQYFGDKGLPLVCYDTDPNNKTLSSYPSLNVEVVDVLRGTRIGEDLIDPMMSSILSNPDQTVLIDTGTSNFLSTLAYLSDNGVVDLLRSMGRAIFIHVPIVGGGDEVDTLEGLAQLAITFNRDSGVGFVVWENDLRGVIRLDDFPVKDFLLENNLLRGVIPIRIGYDDHGAYRGDTFVNDIKRMTESKYTIGDLQEKTQYSDGSVINLMQKHRGVMLYKSWFGALEAVNW